MSTPLQFGLVVCLLVNVVTFAAFGIDKWKAKSGKHRIAELHLIFLAAAMGAFGAWLAVTAFRHKTRKRSFQIKLLIASAANVLILWVWFKIFPLNA